MSLPGRAITYKDLFGGVAIICLMAVVSMTLPIIGFFCAMLAPLPAAVYRLQLGRRNSVTVAGIALLVLAAVSGGITVDWFFFAGLILLGFTLAECMARGLSVEKTVLLPAAAFAGAGMASLLVYSMSLNTGMVALVSQHIAQSLQLTLVLYEEMGMPEDAVQQLAGSLDKLEYALVRVLPAFTLAGLLVVSWVNLLLVRPILRKRSLTCPDFGALNQWRSPEHLVWGVIASGVLIVVAGGDLRLLAVNGLVVFMVVYFFQGIAIVSYYFEKKGVPRFLKLFIYVMIAMQQFLLLLVIGMGFFDVWLNVRKLGKADTD